MVAVFAAWVVSSIKVSILRDILDVQCKCGLQLNRIPEFLSVQTFEHVTFGSVSHSHEYMSSPLRVVLMRSEISRTDLTRKCSAEIIFHATAIMASSVSKLG